ncbi:MAG: hypothetical protein Q8914_12490, partial [Bacteroidota bacterium]|nr:hypothetical protein [Bacteroidota bacterium]
MKKLAVTKNTLLTVFYWLYVLILLDVFMRSMLNGYSKESWNITELLINYQGGFVRRGLLGEGILYVYRLWGVNPYYLILSVCALAYVLLVAFFVRSFIKRGYSIFLLPFVFFLGNPIINDFWVRKDVLQVLIFITVLFFSLKKSTWSVLTTNFFLVVGLLIHEGIGFFCLPIVFLLRLSSTKSSMKGKSNIRLVLYTMLQLSPALLVFLFTLYAKGSEAIAQAIWNSWKDIPFQIQDTGNALIPSAIDALSWSLHRGLSYLYNFLRNFNGGFYAPLAWALILLAIYYVLSNFNDLNIHVLKKAPRSNLQKRQFSNVLLFQLLAVLPLFILGWDYGRWVFYWVASSFAIVLLVPES